jgi:hypothetical protein
MGDAVRQLPQHATSPSAPNEWLRQTCTLMQRLINNVSLVERR